MNNSKSPQEWTILDKNGAEMPLHYSGRYRTREEAKALIDMLNINGECKPYTMQQIPQQMTQNKSPQETKEEMKTANNSLGDSYHTGEEVDLLMEEYANQIAKQTAIAFANFLKDVYYLDGEGFYHHNYQNKVHYTVESLYETFLTNSLSTNTTQDK